MATKKPAKKKAVSGTKRKVTKWQSLQKAVSAECKNPTAANAERVAKAKKSYVSDAVSKGKSAADANKSANKAHTCNPFKRKR